MYNSERKAMKALLRVPLGGGKYLAIFPRKKGPFIIEEYDEWGEMVFAYTWPR